ncbi:MAG: hypothetical protein JWQ73_2499 [Variovorax sp.]|nr:hypothetical protein [Variovorax sp.]
MYAALSRGCGVGELTARLASRCGSVMASNWSESAVFNREKTQRNGDSPLEAIVDRWVV